MVGSVQAAAEPQEPPDYAAYADLKIPPLAPEEALERFELEAGFRIELVAAEPMIYDPVAMDIDPDGRLWVVDMPSYMPVHDRSDRDTTRREQVPQGRVVVLEDTNGDGRMDESRVFFDELILPRAVKVLDDGVLVAEPPHVWLIRDTTGDGRGDERKSIYDGYGNPLSDNVEHMPNGLFWGLDNWLHSAHAGMDSLRRIDGAWRTRPFHRLGQWGMTQDDWGRLYSAHNARPLRVHLTPHGYGGRHTQFSFRSGQDANIAPHEPMWPAHATGVNRGYRVGAEVREDGTLRRATATAGPVIYRGDQFGEEYRGNAFVPEPAGNLIKRYLLEGDPAEIELSARFAYEEKEFLTSTDERFRPVNLYNAPDGSLYVVDLYRGLFQHARFLTDHLREYTEEHDLHLPEADFGRIYRIVREDRVANGPPPRLNEKGPLDWVDFLRHENGLLRDLSQQILVQRSPVEAVASLVTLVFDSDAAAWSRLQALWTLEGFDRGTYDARSLAVVARGALDDPHPRVRAAAVRILEPSVGTAEPGILDRLGALSAGEPAPYVRLQLMASLGAFPGDSALHPMAELLDNHIDARPFREMALTGLHGREERMAAILRGEFGWSEESDGLRVGFLETLEEAELGRRELEVAGLSGDERALFDRGSDLYRTCAACHGDDGGGLDGVATARAGSDWVQGDPDDLVRLVLHGFTGEDDEIGAVMPPHGFMENDEIAAVLTYIRRAWGNDAESVREADVARLREAHADRRDLWTPEELRD